MEDYTRICGGLDRIISMVWLNIAVLLASAVLPLAPQLISSLPASSQDIAGAALALIVVVWHRFSAPTLTAPPVPVAVLAPTPAPPITIVKP